MCTGCRKDSPTAASAATAGRDPALVSGGPCRRRLRDVANGKLERSGQGGQPLPGQHSASASETKPQTFSRDGLAEQPARHRSLGHGGASPAPVGPDRLAYMLIVPSPRASSSAIGVLKSSLTSAVPIRTKPYILDRPGNRLGMVGPVQENGTLSVKSALVLQRVNLLRLRIGNSVCADAGWPM